LFDSKDKITTQLFIEKVTNFQGFLFKHFGSILNYINIWSKNIDKLYYLVIESYIPLNIYL